MQVSSNLKLKLMGKRRTPQKIGVLLKNLRETEICTSNKFKDQKLITKKLLSKY